jgi:hypothetical protein
MENWWHDLEGLGYSFHARRGLKMRRDPGLDLKQKDTRSRCTSHPCTVRLIYIRGFVLGQPVHSMALANRTGYHIAFPAFPDFLHHPVFGRLAEGKGWRLSPL